MDARLLLLQYAVGKHGANMLFADLGYRPILRCLLLWGQQWNHNHSHLPLPCITRALAHWVTSHKTLFPWQIPHLVGCLWSSASCLAVCSFNYSFAPLPPTPLSCAIHPALSLAKFQDIAHRRRRGKLYPACLWFKMKSFTSHWHTRANPSVSTLSPIHVFFCTLRKEKGAVCSGVL